MTPTQHAALMDAIEAGFAALAARLEARLDRMEERQKQIENAMQAIHKLLNGDIPTEFNDSPAPPCGYPSEPAPDGMRWRYVGHGLLEKAKQSPIVKAPCVYWSPLFKKWQFLTLDTMQDGSSDYHYFTAEPV